MQYSICPESREKLIFNYSSDARPLAGKFGPHIHSGYELIYLCGGDATYAIEDRKYRLKKDDLIVIRPNDYHVLQFHSEQPYDRYVVQFDPVALGISMEMLPEGMDVVSCAHMPIITDLFKKVDYYHTCFSEKIVASIIVLLLKELLFNLCVVGQNADLQRISSVHPLIQRALALINAELFTIENVGEVAQKLYVTESYLYRLFKKELMTTPGKYITEKRLLAARNMLLQGRNPTQVYVSCGFTDYSAFYRNYQSLFGYPPSKEEGEIIARIEEESQREGFC